MSGSNSPVPPPLQNLLTEEAAQLRDFLVLLEQEQQALAAGDVERLLFLAAEKNERFGRLAQLGEARGKALVAAGLGAIMLVALLVSMAFALRGSDHKVLFSNLSEKDCAVVIAKLDQMTQRNAALTVNAARRAVGRSGRISGT